MVKGFSLTASNLQSNMIKKYEVTLISIAPNGKNNIYDQLSDDCIGFFGTLCIMKGNNSILGGNFVVAFDENMKCLFSDVGVIQQLEDTIIITTKDRIFTFGVYYKAF